MKTIIIFVAICLIAAIGSEAGRVNMGLKAKDNSPVAENEKELDGLLALNRVKRQAEGDGAATTEAPKKSGASTVLKMSSPYMIMAAVMMTIVKM